VQWGTLQVQAKSSKKSREVRPVHKTLARQKNTTTQIRDQNSAYHFSPGVPLEQHQSYCFNHQTVRAKEHETEWTSSSDQGRQSQKQPKNRGKIHHQRIDQRMPVSTPFETPHDYRFDQNDLHEVKNEECGDAHFKSETSGRWVFLF